MNMFGVPSDFSGVEWGFFENRGQSCGEYRKKLLNLPRLL